MAGDDKAILQQLSAKVRLLIQQHGALIEERDRLKAAIDEKDAQLEKLQREYDNLKTARLIGVSGGDVEMAKAKLSRLSREISKCIAMMSV